MQQQFITQCPECQSRFDISLDQLHAADGRVRCGGCKQVFSASKHLETPAPQAKPAPDGSIPSEPLVLTARRRSNGWATLSWSLLILLALTGLGLQILWFERDSLTRQPQLIPLYSELCQRIDCRLSPRQDLPSIRSQRLLLRQHAEYANAVTMNLTLINQAPFDQPFPALQLSFSGMDNSLRAARTFQPREYLSGDLSPSDLMPSRSPVQLHLEMLDPGTLAPNYQLQFVQAKP